jgi:Mn2+/Fe2+ NRAMP family transporter
MGFNTIVIPLVIVVVLVLVNKPQLMGRHTASRPRNLILLSALVLSAWLMLEKLPDYIDLIVG